MTVRLIIVISLKGMSITINLLLIYFCYYGINKKKANGMCLLFAKV